MGSVLRRVRKRKQRSGEVRVVARWARARLGLEATPESFRGFIAPGLIRVDESLVDRVVALAGMRHARDDGQPGRRHGSNPGKVGGRDSGAPGGAPVRPCPAGPGVRRAARGRSVLQPAAQGAARQPQEPGGDGDAAAAAGERPVQEAPLAGPHVIAVVEDLCLERRE